MMIERPLRDRRIFKSMHWKGFEAGKEISGGGRECGGSSGHQKLRVCCRFLLTNNSVRFGGLQPQLRGFQVRFFA